jgi:Ca2+-binding EF-hand superfamily protein
MWKHILTIAAFLGSPLDYKSGLKALEQTSIDQLPEGNEKKFVENVLDKIETVIDTDSLTNPMDTIPKLFSSGIITGLVESMNTEMENGNLDIQKLLGMVQTMASRGQ